MDLRYEAFCLADPLFFDEQRPSGAPIDSFSPAVPVPDGWLASEQGIWRSLQHSDVVLPLQGWKIHVSATLSNADRVLAVAAGYCVNRVLAFQHLRDRRVQHARNAKHAPRDGSGTLVTIYPANEQQFATTLAELSEMLHDEPGPYILGDLRYGAGPLYAGYGGFAQRWAELGGTRVPAIEKPDGELVADERTPAFALPDWVSLPDCLEPHLAARRGDDPALFPYWVTDPLHFSNGGGVYRATRISDGTEVVLKEARPHAGLDRDGVDAVARLRHEHDILDRLAGVPGIPWVHSRFIAGEHHFLDMDNMPGRTLDSWLACNYPLSRHDVTAQDLADYTHRALALLDSVAATLADVHRRGVVFGDLHPRNILVDDDDQVSLIDFELAFDTTTPGGPSGEPGFRAMDGRTGIAVDEYAMAALRLWLFLPVTPLLELEPAKLPSFVDYVTQRFLVPASYRETIMSVLGDRTGPASTELDNAKPDWTMVRKSIAQAILASATPHRVDRLFPGDVETFRFGGACFGYGAAGVLYALHTTGQGRYPEHEQWLLDSVRRQPPDRPGFLDGSHGIAYVLDLFGYRDQANELLAASAAMVEQTTGHGLASGLAGIGLTRLAMGIRHEDWELLAGAETLGERLVHVLTRAADPDEAGRAGLLDGWSGPALLFIRLYQHTGDAAWLWQADRALDRDLQECVATEDGSLQVRDDGVGSAGILLVVEELAKMGTGFASLERINGLLDACRGEFCAQPGLFNGRAGLMSALAAHTRRTHRPEVEDAVATHLSQLALHAVPYKDGIAFPGNELLRLSMDVATGSAGVLLALTTTAETHPTTPQ